MRIIILDKYIEYIIDLLLDYKWVNNYEYAKKEHI